MEKTLRFFKIDFSDAFEAVEFPRPDGPGGDVLPGAGEEEVAKKRPLSG